MIKNLNYAKIIELKEQVDYQQGQVVSKTITKSKSVNISLFAFDKSEGLSEHTSTGDALVVILDGKAQVTIGTKKYDLIEGESILLPANEPHALFASEKFKMFLVVVFPQ